MKLLYFVKDGCDACKKSREKVEFYLARWGLSDRLARESFDCETEDGLVEAALREVHDIPTVVLDDEGDEIARWTRRPPTSHELGDALGVAPASAPQGEARLEAPCVLAENPMQQG